MKNPRRKRRERERKRQPLSRNRNPGNEISYPAYRYVSTMKTAGEAGKGRMETRHDKLPSLMPISAILPYEQVREVRRDLSMRLLHAYRPFLFSCFYMCAFRRIHTRCVYTQVCIDSSKMQHSPFIICIQKAFLIVVLIEAENNLDNQG